MLITVVASCYNGYNESYSSYPGGSHYRGLSGSICSINMDGRRSPAVTERTFSGSTTHRAGKSFVLIGAYLLD